MALLPPLIVLHVVAGARVPAARAARWAEGSSSCYVALATQTERRLLCDRMERKMEENTARDGETGV